MRLQLLAVSAVLLLAWVALAAWQWHEFGHEREWARATLQRQADSLTSAVVGGIRSHRRLGRFMQEQLQGAIEELVKSKDVLAVVITSHDGQPLVSAGKTGQLSAAPVAVGQWLEPAGFRHVAEFELVPGMAGPPGGTGRGWRGGRGHGMGGGPPEEVEGPFSAGGKFKAVLLLDRSGADAQCARAARLRTWVVVAGGIVLVCIALVWLATIRMIQARARTGMLEAEARHLRELSQAAAGLAHETRNPLSLVRGWTQRLAQSELHSTEGHGQAQTVIEECDRVTSRINQFLAFARPCKPNPQSVRPAEIVDELAALLEPDLDARQLKLERRVSAPGQVVRADREMMRQALFNLLQNAIQFAPEGGTVEINVTRRHDGACRIEVADQGPGVPPEAVESLFSPYFTTRRGGTGLGLAIVRQIATAHGWQVGHRPRSGGGSVFYLDRMHG